MSLQEARYGNYFEDEAFEQKQAVRTIRDAHSEPSEVNEAFRTLKRLRSTGELESNAPLRNELTKITEETPNEWIRLRLKNILRQPLEEWPVFLQRRLLEAESGNLGLTAQEIAEMPESEIQLRFQEYRNEEFEYFLLHERFNLLAIFESRSPGLSEAYSVKPELLSGTDDSVFREQSLSGYSFIRISPDLGALYSPDGRIESTFELDPDERRQEKKEETFFGSISLRHMKHLVQTIRRAHGEREREAVAVYIQARRKLPVSVRESCDAKLGITDLPEELDRRFESQEELKKALAGRRFVWDDWPLDQRDSARAAVEQELSALLSAREDEYRESHLGTTLTRQELSVLHTCVGKRSGHNSVLRFFVRAADFPDAFLQRFDEAFPHLRESVGLEDIGSLDDYLRLPTKILDQKLDQIEFSKFFELSSWLADAIADLVQELHEKAITPVFVDFEDAVKLADDAGASAGRRAEVIEDAQALVDLSLRREIEQFFSIHLEDFRLREQLRLLRAVKSGDRAVLERVKFFVSSFGPDALRSFLATENDDSFIDTLLRLPEVLPVETVRRVLSRFSELAVCAQDVGQLLQALPVLPDASKKIDMQQLQDDIMYRGKELIALAASGDTKVVGQLAQARADLALFSAVFKRAVGAGAGSVSGDVERLNLQDVYGLELRHALANNISEQEREEMLAIAKDNWREVPSMTGVVLHSLETAINAASEDTTFAMLNKDGHIAAFVRFDERPDGSLYVGSVNVRPDLRGSAIGTAFFHETIDEAAKEAVLTLNAYPDQPIASAYVEKFGFVITGVEEVPLEGGEKEYGFSMERDDRKKGQYTASSLSVEQLKDFSQATRPLEAGLSVRKYDLSIEKGRMLDDIRQAEKQGFVASRFVIDPQEPNVRYLTFEREIRAEERKAA